MKSLFTWSKTSIAALLILTYGCNKNDNLNSNNTEKVALTNQNTLAAAAITSNPYKVAYYAFDHGGPRISTFAPGANVVVLFEGTPFEMADSIHYGSTSSYMFSNANYKSYKAILADVQVLQSKGVKVLWNIDDASAWQTATPFTTYNGVGLTAAQYAAFVKSCVIDSLHMDGIALDQEHIQPYSTTPNTNYLAVLNSLSSYFGLKSSNPLTIFTSATGYNVAYGLNPIKNNTAYAANMNFVMDMGYNVSNSYRVNTRLKPFASITNFGWPKTMTGVDVEGNTVGGSQFIQDSISSAWEPSGTNKAGIMVYAANGDTAYAGRIFRAYK